MKLAILYQANFIKYNLLLKGNMEFYSLWILETTIFNENLNP